MTEIKYTLPFGVEDYKKNTGLENYTAERIMKNYLDLELWQAMRAIRSIKPSNDELKAFYEEIRERVRRIQYGEQQINFREPQLSGFIDNLIVASPQEDALKKFGLSRELKIIVVPEVIPTVTVGKTERFLTDARVSIYQGSVSGIIDYTEVNFQLAVPGINTESVITLLRNGKEIQPTFEDDSLFFASVGALGLLPQTQNWEQIGIITKALDQYGPDVRIYHSYTT